MKLIKKSPCLSTPTTLATTLRIKKGLQFRTTIDKLTVHRI